MAISLLLAGCSQAETDREPQATGRPGMTTSDHAVPVADAVSGGIEAAGAVSGFFVADEPGARLCELLLESFPPQCGGASLPVGDFELDMPTTSESGVTWSPDVVVLEGEIIGGVFQPLR